MRIRNDSSHTPLLVALTCALALGCISDEDVETKLHTEDEVTETDPPVDTDVEDTDPEETDPPPPEQPVITSIDRIWTNTRGGQTLTIEGLHLDDGEVEVGALEATESSVSPTKIVLDIPEGLPATLEPIVAVRVTAPGGEAEAEQRLRVYQYEGGDAYSLWLNMGHVRRQFGPAWDDYEELNSLYGFAYHYDGELEGKFKRTRIDADVPCSRTNQPLGNIVNGSSIEWTFDTPTGAYVTERVGTFTDVSEDDQIYYHDFSKHVDVGSWNTEFPAQLSVRSPDIPEDLFEGMQLFNDASGRFELTNATALTAGSNASVPLTWNPDGAGSYVHVIAVVYTDDVSYITGVRCTFPEDSGTATIPASAWEGTFPTSISDSPRLYIRATRPYSRRIQLPHDGTWADVISESWHAIGGSVAP